VRGLAGWSAERRRGEVGRARRSVTDLVVRRRHRYGRNDRIGNALRWRQDQSGERQLWALRTDRDRSWFRRGQFGRCVRRGRFLHGWPLGGAGSVVVVMMIGRDRVCREMTVNSSPVVMAGLVRRVLVQMHERCRQGAQLQAETDEQHEAEALHVSRIVAHIPRVVKDAGFVAVSSRRMSLPFSADDFFDVFARYNLAQWPAALALWLTAGAVLLALVRSPGPRTDRLVVIVLVALWTWGGTVYHAVYFTAVNPAAWVFALLFLMQAGLLVWSGLERRQLLFGSASSAATRVGTGLALYALAYPGLGFALGHPYPAAPSFGVPCPTTIFTVGVLLTCRRLPVMVALIPLVWSLIGGSAALLLGVTADYVLLACAPILVAHLMQRDRPAGYWE
jgi:hypothetical protein